MPERYKAAYESLLSKQDSEMQAKIVSAKDLPDFDMSVRKFVCEVIELAESDKIIQAPVNKKS